MIPADRDAPSSSATPQAVSEDLDVAWREHAAEVMERCFVWMGGHADDAKEAFSRAWARAAANLILHRPALVDPRAWLLTLAYRVCMDLHRERARRAEEALEKGAPIATSAPHFGPVVRDPERMVLGKELVVFLKQSVDDLPPRLRDAMLTYMASGDYRDVVERFGITDVNARKRIQQARAILRERLVDYRAGRTLRNRSQARPRPRKARR